MKRHVHSFIKARGETRKRRHYRRRTAVTVIEATCTPPGAPGAPVVITLWPPADRWMTVGITGVMVGTCPHCGRCITNRDITDWAPMPLVSS